MKFENENTFNIKKSKGVSSSSSNWYMSYADIVTALLCFFIIFYAIEKNLQNKVESSSFHNSISQSVAVKPHKDGEVTTNKKYLIDSLKKIPGIQIVEASAFIDIHFKEIIFFDQSSYELRKEAKEHVNFVLEKISKLDARYRLEIQGHADKTPVKEVAGRWWKNNIQLSMLRALNVYEYSLKVGIPEENLVITGYGHNKSLDENTDKIINHNRRISLRLQVVENE